MAEPPVLVLVADGRHGLLVAAVVRTVRVATFHNLPLILATEINIELLSIIKEKWFLFL